MKKIDGKEVAKLRREQLAQKIQDFEKQHGVTPRLDVVLVGDDPASHVYVKNKEKACDKVGIRSRVHRMVAGQGQEALENLVSELNEDGDVDAILIQFPLPKGYDQERVLHLLRPDKDADGLTTENLGLLWSGRKRVSPCTPSGITVLLEHVGIPLTGKKAVVIGRSLLVGKPIAHLLMEANATVTICHSRTADLQKETQGADIVVVAAGRPRFVGKDHFRKGATVIDVGIHRDENGKLCGDVDPEGLENHLAALTPVPGGVGPMTIAMLLENTLTLAQLRRA